MIKASLTVKHPTFGLSVRKIWFRDKDEIYRYKGAVRTIEGTEVTNIVITAID